MSYIRISNKAENVNRLFLEKLGLSTKRDDENTIGQFGSGSKFAPIAALRNGWEWINVGCDEIGPYRMEYVSKEENGINSIFYKYVNEDEVTLKPSSFTLEAGILSWDSVFQIFREAFANALDEYIAHDVEYDIEIVEEVEYEEGVFAVYITAAPELMKILDNFDQYFDINRAIVYQAGYTGLIYDSMGDHINIYHKGVFVYGDDQTNAENIPSLFDYSLNNVALNEERRLRDSFYAASSVANVWNTVFRCTLGSVCSEKIYRSAVDISKKILQADTDIDEDLCWELYTINDYSFSQYKYDLDNALRRAWGDIYGDNAIVLLPSQSRFVINIEKVYQRRAVIVHSSVLQLVLNNAGVDFLDDVIGDEAEFDFIEFSGGPKLDMLNNAKEILAKYDDRMSRVVDEIKIFAPGDMQSGLLGVAKQSSIYLSLKAFNSMEVLIGALIHELDHIISGLADEDREFRSIADERIADLIIKLYGS